MRYNILLLGNETDDLDQIAHALNSLDTSNKNLAVYDINHVNSFAEAKKVIKGKLPQLVISETSNDYVTDSIDFLCENYVEAQKTFPFSVLFLNKKGQNTKSLIKTSNLLAKYGKGPVCLTGDELEVHKGSKLYSTIESILEVKKEEFKKENKARLDELVFSGLHHSLQASFMPVLGILSLLISQLEEDGTCGIDYLDKIKDSFKDASVACGLGKSMMHYFNLLCYNQPEKFLTKKLVGSAVSMLPQELHESRISYSNFSDFEINGSYSDVFGGIINVLLNASEARKGSVCPSINISIEADVGYNILSIKENGRGMDEETLARAFDPKFTTKECHSGLGLYVLEEVMQMQKGKIEIESKVNEGTTVKLYFPVVK